jgi:hypothetical protein
MPTTITPELPEVAAELTAGLRELIAARICTVCYQTYGPGTGWMCPCFSCFTGYAKA